MTPPLKPPPAGRGIYLGTIKISVTADVTSAGWQNRQMNVEAPDNLSPFGPALLLLQAVGDFLNQLERSAFARMIEMEKKENAETNDNNRNQE